MANQPEATTYDAGVYQLEATDPVDGGVGAVSNKPLLNLANRTNYLKQHVDNLEAGVTIPPTVAALDSPIFTGTPTVPMRPLGDNSNAAASTAWVDATLSGLTTVNVAGNANVNLTAVQAGSGVLKLTGALTGNIAVIVPSTSSKWIVWNATTGAFSLTVKTASGSGVAVTQGKTIELFCDGTNVLVSTTDFVSPALTGVPTAPTATADVNSVQLATTAYVQRAKNGAVSVNVAGNANVALTAQQAGVGIVMLTGALTGNITVTVPQATGQYILANNTTGAYSLTVGVAGSAGTTATVPQGQSVVAYSDGTNVVLAGAAASSVFSRYAFTATAGQKVFAAPYTVGNLLVLVNGAIQSTADITASDGANVTLTAYNGGAGCTVGDAVELIALSSFTVANAMPTAGGTFVGPVSGPTPAQFDSSTLLSTTAFVQRALGNFSGSQGIGASTTLTASQAGQFFNVAAGSATTITMPLTTACPIGSTYTFQSTSSAATITLVPQGSSDKIVVNGSSMSSINMQYGDDLTLVNIGANFWFAKGSAAAPYLARFALSNSANGYQKLPSGLIIQWGHGAYSGASGSTLNATYPIAFPNAALLVTGTIGSSMGDFTLGFQIVDTANFSIGVHSVAGANASGAGYGWIAVGY